MGQPFLVRIELTRYESTTGGYRHYGVSFYNYSSSKPRYEEGGTVKLPYDLTLPIPYLKTLTLGQFLHDFRKGTGSVDAGGRQVGRWLYDCLFEGDIRLRKHWERAREEFERRKRPLRLELMFPHPSQLVDSAANVEELPFELLADDNALFFRRPGYTLVRCYEGQLVKTFDIPRGARALLAWANPKQGSHRPIPDEVIEGHKAALTAFKEALGWTVVAPCANATYGRLEGRLSEAKTPIFSMVAHGKEGGGELLLEATGESVNSLRPDQLAALCKRGGVQLAILWTCHSAAWRANTGSLVAALLDSTQGDVAAVISAHGALEATGTVTLAKALLKSLANTHGELDQALFAARVELPQSNIQWAIPVYYARPRHGRTVRMAERQTRSADAEAPEIVPGLMDAPPDAFMGDLPMSRQKLLEQGLEMLRRDNEPVRLVSVIGVPGIGKTAVVRRLADQAMEELGIKRALWISADQKKAELLRTHIALWFLPPGAHAPEKYEHDRQLAQAIGNTPLLLVFDSAEVYLWEDTGRGIFLELLKTLLSECPRLRVLLATQEALEENVGSLRKGIVPVSALSEDEARTLFLSLAQRDGPEAVSSEESSALEGILKELSGHPRSLVLVAGQLAKRRQPGDVLEILKDGRLEHIRHASLSPSEKDSGEKRDYRLSISFNLVYDYLLKKHQSVAEVFAWMGEALPAGATYTLLEGVFQGEDWCTVPVLRRENLVDEVGESRLIIPAPLNIYARGKAALVPRQRSEELLARVLSAYAAWFVEACARLGTPQGTQVLKETLADTANIEKLSSLVRKGISRSHCGQLFSSWAKVMLYAGPASRLLPVMERVLVYLRATDRNFRWVGGIYYRAKRRTASLLKKEAPPRDEPLAQVLEALGDVYARMSEAQQAEKAYREALWRYRSVEDSLGVANVQKALGELHANRAQFQQAETLYLQALKIYQTLDKHPGAAEIHKALGDLYSRQDTRLQDAVAAYTKARVLFQETGWPLGEAHAYSLLGGLQFRMSKLTEAEMAYEQALGLYRRLEWYPGVAEICKALGDIHMERDIWAHAENCYNEALQMYGKVESRRGEAATLQAQGDLYRMQDKLKEAEQVLERALSLYQEVGNRLGQANTLQSQGDLLTKQGKFQDAEATHVEGLRLSRSLEYSWGIYMALKSLGELISSRGALVTDKSTLEEALTLHQQQKNLSGEILVLKGLGDIELHRNSYDLAYAYYLHALELAEQVFPSVDVADLYTRAARAAVAADRPELGLYWSTHALELLSHAPSIKARPGRVLVLQVLADSARLLGQPIADDVLRTAWHIATDLGHPDAPKIASQLAAQVSGFNPDVRPAPEELQNLASRIIELMRSHDAELVSRGIHPRRRFETPS